MATRSRASRPEKTERYDQKLALILRASARVFARKGFHAASMRDISRETGISLAGLYYYFKTKDELLYLILADTFDRVIARLDASVDDHQGPGRIRFFIENHLRYFVENLPQMKVASHESESLSGKYRRQVQAKKRLYFGRLVNLLAAEAKRGGPDPKVAALSLFGMVNWIYTWYEPRRDGKEIDQVVETMAAIFLRGYLG